MKNGKTQTVASLNSLVDGKKITRFWCSACILVTCLLIALIVTWGVLSQGFKDRFGHVMRSEIEDNATPARLRGSRFRSREPLDICLSPECVLTAAVLLESMNLQVDPCDDFYEFVCGAFDEQYSIPEERQQYGSLRILSDSVSRLLQSILNEKSKKYPTKALNAPLLFYRSCLNAGRADASLAPLNKTLEYLGGWPVLGAHTPFRFSWERQEGKLREFGFTSGRLLSTIITADPSNSSRYVMIIDEPATTDRRDEADTDEGRRKLDDYKGMLVDSAVLLGANRASAVIDVDDVVELENNVTEHMFTKAEIAIAAANLSAAFKPYTIGQFREHFPNIDWNGLLQPYYTPERPLVSSEVVLVSNVKYISWLNSVVRKLDTRLLLNYMNMRAVMSVISYLPDKYNGPRDDWILKTGGRKDTLSYSSRQCADATVSALPELVGSLFVRRYGANDVRMKVESLISDLKGSLVTSIETSNWMDAATRKEALEKAAKMGQKVAYSMNLLNDTYLDDYAKSLVLTDNDVFQNKWHIERWKLQKKIRKFSSDVDDEAWSMAPVQINAYYSSNGNEIALPLSLFRLPLFNVAAPPYVNYAKIGFIMGHELTHGFDDTGRQFDAAGNMRNWWQNSTLDAYRERARCFAQQYSDMGIPNSDIKPNGNVSLNENVADCGGLRIAYRAYKDRISKGPMLQKLPGLQSFTDDQMFFISFSNTWCDMVRESYVETALTENEHAIGRLRSTIPVMNMQEFADAFECKQLSNMVPEKRCHLW